MELVYVLGIASRNQSPMPFMNPTLSALTRSFTIRPSRCATAILNTVLRTRRHECAKTIKVSFDLHDGKAIRKMARICLKNVLSKFGL